MGLGKRKRLLHLSRWGIVAVSLALLLTWGSVVYIYQAQQYRTGESDLLLTEWPWSGHAEESDDQQIPASLLNALEQELSFQPTAAGTKTPLQSPESKSRNHKGKKQRKKQYGDRKIQEDKQRNTSASAVPAATVDKVSVGTPSTASGSPHDADPITAPAALDKYLADHNLWPHASVYRG